MIDTYTLEEASSQIGGSHYRQHPYRASIEAKLAKGHLNTALSVSGAGEE